MPGPPAYRRLTFARARSPFAVAFSSRSSLWRGEDHLLAVDSNGYTETYKRFYFRDIQAVIVQQTRRRAVVNGVLAWIACVLLVLGGFVFQLPGLKISFLAAAGFFGFLILLNTLLGPTCKSFLRTAVQIEELPSLNRLRRARKILARLRPLIAAAQGEQEPPEAVSARMRDWVQGSTFQVQRSETAERPAPQP